MALSNIKEKMQKIKDDIDASEERELNARQLLKDAEAREQVHVNEAESMQRRITLLTQDLAKAVTMYEEVEEKLHNEVGKTNADEEVRRKLEDWELKGDEKIQELEERVKEKEDLLKEKAEILTEAERKEVVLKRDLEKAEVKGDTLEERVDKLTEMLTGAAMKVQSLEQGEDEIFEREDLNEEKIKFLEEQVKISGQTCEDAEREAQKLERICDQVQTEITHYNDLTEESKKEMTKIEDYILGAEAE